MSTIARPKAANRGYTRNTQVAASTGAGEAGLSTNEAIGRGPARPVVAGYCAPYCRPLLAVALLAQLADVATFLIVTHHYGTAADAIVAGAEAGPLRYIWAAGNATGGRIGGPLAVVAAKAAAVALVLALTPRKTRGYWPTYAVLAFMALVGALGAIANVSAL